MIFLQEDRPREANDFDEAAFRACSSVSDTSIRATVPYFRIEDLCVQASIAAVEIVRRWARSAFSKEKDFKKSYEDFTTSDLFY